MLSANALNAACDKFLYDRHVPLAHDRILEAADCVKRLFAGKAVKRARIDEEMGLSKPATLTWLKRARDAGLIEFDEVGRGWIPASIADGCV